jgi:hypothetical protein
VLAGEFDEFEVGDQYLFLVMGSLDEDANQGDGDADEGGFATNRTRPSEGVAAAADRIMLWRGFTLSSFRKCAKNRSPSFVE